MITMKSCRQIKTYLSGYPALVRHFRLCSRARHGIPQTHKPARFVVMAENSSLNQSWPDQSLGPVEAVNPRCPLPGNVGTSTDMVHSDPRRQTLSSFSSPLIPAVNDLPTSRTEHQISIMQQAVKVSSEEADAEESVSTKNILECAAHECPQLLIKELSDLFPDRDLFSSRLTALTLCQKTVNDMSGWSPAVEEEREQLLETFVNSAIEICASLKESGFWADFIDPSSGKPYLGSHTNSTLFETDCRMRNFGFTINNLGCCKVVTHREWGSKAYVGVIFTEAPLNHPSISEIHA